MNAWRLLLLAGGGVGAFLAAAQWSRPADPGAEAGLELSTPVDRPRAAAAAAPSASATGPADPALAVGSLALPARSRSIPNPEHAAAFEALNWQPPKPPPPVVQAPPPPPPPPAPTAPKLPFAFMGIVERGAQSPQAYVSKGEALLIVAAGDVIESGTYRVESIEPTSIVFTYLPLGTRQTLAAPGVTP